MLAAFVLAGCYVPSPGDALVADPLAKERVFVWTRTADGIWTFDPTPIAYDWSSLDAHVIDGELVLAGLNHTHRPADWELPLHHPLLEALVTTDLVTWTGRRYWGRTNSGGVDPAFAQDADGAWWAWVVYTPSNTTDPAAPRSKTYFERAELTGGWAGALETWAVPDAVVDVMPVTFHGQLHVYGTHHSRQIVEVHPDGSQTVVWDGATVPFVRVVDDTLELTAQVGTPVDNVHRSVLVGGTTWERRTVPHEDRRLPYTRRSADGLTWSEPEALDIGDVVDNCASPVRTTFLGKELLFCVEERYDVAMPPPPDGHKAGPPPPPPGQRAVTGNGENP